LACILKSLAPLLWAFVLLTLLVFVFALFLVQITTGHLFDTEGELLPVKQAVHREALVEMFGTMTDALYTLFKAVTGGVAWGAVNAPLLDIHWINGVIFAFYIFLFVFAASNIVTSIFLEQTLRSARLDHDELLRMKIEGTNSAYSLLKARLKEADASGSGFLSSLKLKNLLEDKTVAAYLRMIGVEVHEAWGLCHLLGHETSSISIDEFIVGCLRLQGDLRSIDVAMVTHENNKSAELLRQVLGSNLDVLEDVREALSSLQAYHSDGPVVAEEGAADNVLGYAMPHSPREDPSGALLQSPETPQSPKNSEGFSPPGVHSPRSDTPKSDAPASATPKFGATPGLGLLSVPTHIRPWAGNAATSSCGVPPAVAEHRRAE